ncbi:hypothetical protein B0H10DRAFT_1834850 [Mycena sp. CBHHK59/15]|nr:hypothetical protein B0H10DRAFT_1834850 [Mycena sp. CBHHK59/15]
MVNRRISPDLKACALRLWELGWTELEITQALCVSRTSLYRWRQIFDEFGHHMPVLAAARVPSRALFSLQFMTISSTGRQAEDLYLREVQIWLVVHHDVAISVSALQKTLAQEGLIHKMLQKIALERDKERCRAWKESIHDDFENKASYFVTVDETSKNEHTIARTHGRAMVGERAITESEFIRGPRYSVGAAITAEGYIAVKVVEGSFDALLFFDFSGASYFIFFISASG